MNDKEIFDVRFNDKSRHFADLPQTELWGKVRKHVKALPGANLSGFITDWITEAWIDFSYKNHKFTINDQYGDYWFFVEDPECPEEILREVRNHFAGLLLK
ncbi:MAG: hypothetical protein ACYTHM_04875 [Planctomycetota bacterium]